MDFQNFGSNFWFCFWNHENQNFHMKGLYVRYRSKNIGLRGVGPLIRQSLSDESGEDSKTILSCAFSIL